MKIREQRIGTVVVGSGAAGFQAAIRLWQGGDRDIAILTENVKAGTSRNTGSDKQTYYKLSLAAGDSDSVLDMAEDLFAGQCVDGDIALCEAALSAQSFFRLLELGVPFPSTEYGEYMGYKTDHDRGRRATSAGPYTSKLMTECLERYAMEQKIPVLDRMQMIRLMVYNEKVYGLLCLDKNCADEDRYVLIWCSNVILATGGPAGMYHDSVYPESQLGSSGVAFEAGIKGKNLTEWQFGMASLHPRWNVSGTYMQVLPRFVSTDQNGNDEKEFLNEFYKDPAELQNEIFLKGYQWPFDVNKIYGGSSVIDLLVYRETILRGRKVFLDFTQNAGGGEIAFETLSNEAYSYLNNAGALFGTPIERLAKMNMPAIQYYLDHKVDLTREKLEIAICAQHNNGGLSTDANWETNVSGVFAVGEVCGSHGVTRPGGTALNAGQVGAIRASRCIRLRKKNQTEEQLNSETADATLREEAQQYILLPETCCGNKPVNQIWIEASIRMSTYGGMIRNREGLQKALRETEAVIETLPSVVKRPTASQLPLFYRLKEMLTAQKVYLAAMLNYLESGGGSRGSALYSDPAGKLPDAALPGIYQCRLDQGEHGDVIQEIQLNGKTSSVFWRKVRSIPKEDYFFENQWRAYREREGL